MSGTFEGAWLVHEHVFAPDGRALGRVRQRRLVTAEGARLRVVQDCWPDPSLDGHPLAAFRGHHEFTVVVDGATRRYQGPAVVGSGWALADGFMLGRGVWPELGWSFRSWAALCGPERQLTGGTFLRAGLPVAQLVGIAVPEAAGHEPTLEGPTWAGEVCAGWRGTLVRIDARGERVVRPVARVYRGATFVEREADVTVEQTLGAAGDGLRVHGRFNDRPLVGFARRHGWSTTLEAVVGAELAIESLEVVDASGGHLVVFRQVFRDLQLACVEVLELRPEVQK
jgi:hypothetical protein